MNIQVEWQKGAITQFMGTLPAETPPGKSWKYNTGESYLVSAVMEGATGTNLADYLSSRIWSRIGTESDARWWTESEDGMVISGTIATLLQNVFKQPVAQGWVPLAVVLF